MFAKFKRVSMLALVLGIGAATAPLDAQTNSTIVLKNGQRHTGRNLTYRVDRRELAVRVSLHEEPRVNVDQVAYVDFGGTPDSTVELSGSENAVVMRDGAVVKGQIIELGHEKAGDESSTFLVIFRTTAGEERRVPASQVGRVYFSGGRSVGTGGVGLGQRERAGRFRHRRVGDPGLDANRVDGTTRRIADHQCHR